MKPDCVPPGLHAPAPPRPLRNGRPRVRDRIFEAAGILFYRHGIRAVGVDAIACEAGTNKVSFYRSFASKDELVAEYLRSSGRNFWLWWERVVGPYAGQPRRQAEALFETFITKDCSVGDQGCAMANAATELRASEHPALALVREHKALIRARFRALAVDMGAARPQELGDALLLLFDGAAQSRLLFPAAQGGPAGSLPAVARSLIESYLDQQKSISSSA